MPVMVRRSPQSEKFASRIRIVLPVFLAASVLFVAATIAFCTIESSLFSAPQGVRTLVAGMLMLLTAIAYSVGNLLSRPINAQLGIFWVFAAGTFCLAVLLFVAVAVS